MKRLIILVITMVLAQIIVGQNYSKKVFDSALSFTNTKFDDKVTFFQAEFKDSVQVLWVKFNYGADFSESVFQSPTYFINADFYKKSSFRFSIFHSTVSFYEGNFESNADFTKVKFQKQADFMEAIFTDHVDFSYAKFASDADFNLTKFSKLANFGGAEFDSIVDFTATLPDTLIFTDVTKIRYPIDFTVAKLDSTKKAKDKGYKCKINLLGTDLNKIRINYNLFQLYFPANTPYEEKISMYEKLLAKFKADGFLESYQLLDVEYRDYKNRYHRDHFVNWFQKHWWNYGYNKEWVIYWSLLLFLVFSIINAFVFKRLQENVYEIKFNYFTDAEFLQGFRKAGIEPDNKKITDTFFGRIILLVMFMNVVLARFINSLIYTGSLFFGVRLSLENFKKVRGWTIYILIVYFIGLFCLAYIFNIIIVK